MSRMRAACRRKTRSLFENKESQKICGFSGFQFSREGGRSGNRHFAAVVLRPSRSDFKSEKREKMRLAKRLAFFRFDFSFGIIKGEQPLIRGSSASKSLRPCRAEHAAFASQTGLRLKSPTGAFMPCGHRRPFWFSFGAKREHPLSKPLSPAAPPPPAGPARPAGRRPAAPRSRSAPRRCRAAHAGPARPQRPLPAP